MRSKVITVLIKTIIIILSLLIVYSTIIFFVKNSFFLSINVSQTVYFAIITLVQLFIILICLKLICRKQKILNFNSLLKILRLKKITKRTLYISIIVLLLSNTLSILISFILEYFSTSFDPNEQIDLYKSIGIVDNPILLISVTISLALIGPLNEEILFRGYLLPKQEKVFGKYAWILNGFAFNLSHLLVYDFASLLLILPMSLLIPYTVQKHKDTSIGLLAHLFINTGFIIRLFI